MYEAVVDGLIFGAVLALWMWAWHLLLRLVAGPPR